MPEKFARVDGQSTNFSETLFHKSHILTSASTGVHQISFRKDQRRSNSADADFTVEGDHWNYLHNFLYRSGSSKNNADEQDKFSLIYDNIGQLHPNKPLYKTKFYDSGSVFYIPQVYMGERIQSGSFQLVARTGSYDNTTKQILIRDDGNGNLYSTNAEHSQSVGSLSSQENYVGNIFYELGVVVLSETGSWSGSVNYTDIARTDGTAEQTYRYWDLRINSTLPIYTSQYSIRVNSGDFNSTMNQTALGESSGSNTLPMANLKAKLTGSGWSPYFNQIQLYRNQQEEPLFIANLPHSVKTRDDVDFIITFRLDH